MKHEINFGGKILALDKQEIIALLPELEPYYVAIMMGTSDFDIPEFVRDYMSNINGNRQRVKKSQNPKPETEKVHYENNVYDFSDYKKQQEN